MTSEVAAPAAAAPPVTPPPPNARRDVPVLVFSITLLISVICNAYICCRIAANRTVEKPSLAEQEEIARALFVWDVRRSTSVLPATDHQLVLSTKDGKITYEFDRQSRVLTRSTGSESFTLLREVESASFLFCQRPRPGNERRGTEAGLVLLNWRTRNAKGGLEPERSAAACL